jgi:hypothetical protein
VLSPSALSTSSRPVSSTHSILPAKTGKIQAW